MRTIGVIVSALVATATVGSTAYAQDFTWSGRLAQGRTIEVKGLNGQVRATAATGNEISVTATKREGRHGYPEDVTIEVVEHEGGVTICAVYPTPEGESEPNVCAPGEEGRMNNRRNNVKVDFEVRVPRGVRFAGRNVNGSVSATGLASNVIVHTVNGNVRVTTDATVEAASTVNGSVDVTMGRADWADDLDIRTVNGNIAVAFGSELDTEVRAETVNGHISTDWPLTVQGRFGPRRITGTVGNGGRTLSLATVNGDIDLRRR